MLNVFERGKIQGENICERFSFTIPDTSVSKDRLVFTLRLVVMYEDLLSQS